MNYDTKQYLAGILLRCWKCNAKPSDDKALQRCGGCKRIAYCANECQKGNWPQHKSFCKAFRSLESDPYALNMLLVGLYDDRPIFSSELERLHVQSRNQSAAKAMLVNLRNSLPNRDEMDLFKIEPRCFVCTRTSQDLRMEEAYHPGAYPPRAVLPCDDCNLSFYCSEDHNRSGRQLHSEIPHEDGLDGLSQCQINQGVMVDYLYAEEMFSETPEIRYHYQPGPVKSSWESLIDQTWRGEYLPPITEANGTSPRDEKSSTMLRHSTDVLTVAMTILFALEKLNPGNETWTNQESLTVHIVGANRQEFQRLSSLHEIFHRLSNLRVIKVLLCGPELHSSGPNAAPYEQQLLDCLSCQARSANRGDKIAQSFYGDTYHAFVESQGANYEVPDLAIAFNTDCGAGIEDQSVSERLLDLINDSSSWRETERILVRKKVPTLFTAPNSESARKDEKRLKIAGAISLPGLERQINPWGSMLSFPRPMMIRAFESYNRWIVGGFR